MPRHILFVCNKTVTSQKTSHFIKLSDLFYALIQWNLYDFFVVLSADRVWWVFLLSPSPNIFLGGASFSCPGCDLMWLQYSLFKIGSLQTGQFPWPHLWCPRKAGWIVTLHLTHLFSKEYFTTFYNTKCTWLIRMYRSLCWDCVLV